MMHTDKVKLMDSGTVLFHAGSLEEARARVKGLLSPGAVEETAPGCYTADFSGLVFYRTITAKVEATSRPGVFAASFREGNRCRFPLFPFSSRKALGRMERIRRDLAD